MSKILELSESLNYKQKVDRSLSLIEDHWKKFGKKMVAAISFGKDSSVVWNLCKRVSKDIPAFAVTTRFKPEATKQFMREEMERYPEIKVFKNDCEIEEELYKKDPDKCCNLLKVIPTSQAIRELEVKCWITGLRATEGRTRVDYEEVEQRDENLLKINPILIWHEREIWQYLALNKINVNPLYSLGYRSLGCEPCSTIVAGGTERDGRWIGTSKCGGECGIHTRSLLGK